MLNSSALVRDVLGIHRLRRHQRQLAFAVSWLACSCTPVGEVNKHGTQASTSASTSAAGRQASAAAQDGWFCTQVGSSCTCVQVGDLSRDTCDEPKPTCCFTLTRLGANACTCWPDDSEECRSQMSDVPDAKPSERCPPPL